MPGNEMEVQQPVPIVLDLDTPPPSPPSIKKPKLEYPPDTSMEALHLTAEDPHSEQSLQDPHQEERQAPSFEDAHKEDLPEDFLEPLDIYLNQENITFPLGVASIQKSSPSPSPLPSQSPHPCDTLPPLVSSSPHPQQLQSTPPCPSLLPPQPQTLQNAEATSIPHPQQLQNADSTSVPHVRSMEPPSILPLLLRQQPHVPRLRGRLPPIASLSPHLQEVPDMVTSTASSGRRACRQFWKAGDYEADRASAPTMFPPGGIDHVRVHPKFLHSNATSHKWALGAVAELLDNALDEVGSGATFVNVDMIRNPQDGGPMLLFEDDGGGMNPDCLRQCMSLGYSAKSKRANTIGQYGNGFKTSTMRLGSDVLVFSRFPAKAGGSPTQSIGMLSYSFLRDTSQEDIIVPMVDYEIEPFGLRKSIRSTVEDWDRNMTTITKWSPYHSEAELLYQFNDMKHQGTKIILYNLWEDDEGEPELDFDTDPYDIQVRGANRDEKKIAMAAQYPNSRHYLTYRHSLRSYASILYLRLPSGFRMILRGKEVEHHPLVDDMMFTQEHTYKPHSGGGIAFKETNMVAVVTIGFVKDAKEHIDVQGFNVYHKNRLIKPFWRIWNAASSEGRGIIAVLEANFVEPAHDKQGFERTLVLGRLESRLLLMQKSYWKEHCHKVGYAKKDSPRVHYPAWGIRRSEALLPGGRIVTRSGRSEALLPGGRIVTRSGLSTEDASLSPQSPSPEIFLMAHVTQEDDPSTIPISGQKGVSTDGMRIIDADSATSPNSTLTSPQRVENGSSPANRTEANDKRLLMEVEKIRRLKSMVLGLEKVCEDLKDCIDRVTKERDILRSQVKEQARWQAIEEEELRSKLKAAHLRIKQLEGGSNWLQAL